MSVRSALYRKRMTPSRTALASASVPFVLLLTQLLGPSAASAQPHLRGLNPDELSTRETCATAPPGYARCAAEQLIYKASGAPVRSVPASAGAPATGATSPAISPAITPAGYGPGELQSAYNLTTLAAAQGAGETIAVVDAYDDPNAEADLAVYRSQYGLPPCKAGCFTKDKQTGTKASPPGKEDWSVEISLDLDMASAICPQCHLLLTEAKGDSLGDLAQAAHEAATTSGVVAVSNSYTASEGTVLPELSFGERATYEQDYTQPGVAFTAAAGDAGYEVNVPAVLSTVTAVGGTSLQPDGDAWSQAAWSLSCTGSGSSRKCSGTGGGCSEYVAKPAWQLALGSADEGCSMRTNNDLSADADPDTGAAIYDTDNGNGGWNVVGGTSESSPIVAGFYALIGQQAGVGGAAWDYEHPSFFRDVLGGSDQLDCASYLCEALVGFDGPTGLGTPDGAGEQEGPAGGGEEEGEPTGEEPGGGSEPGSEPGKEETRKEEGKGSDGGDGEAESPREGGTGSQPETSSSGAPGGTIGAQPAAGATSTSSPTPTAQPMVKLSAVALTPNALLALSHSRPAVSRIAFQLTLNATARVRITLAKQVHAHARMRWQTLPYSLTILGTAGRDSAHLNARATLSPGEYRLTLAPVHGVARTLTFQIG
jgi:hypothetical protein